MKKTECLPESTRLFPKGNKREADDCLNKFLETLVFSFHSMGNTWKIAFLRYDTK